MEDQPIPASTGAQSVSPSNPAQQAQEAVGQKGQEDLSKNTIIVLVMLTLIISILGTWTVLNEVNGIRLTSSQTKDSGPASANVQLNILSPEEYARQGTGAATGRVVFNINRA